MEGLAGSYKYKGSLGTYDYGLKSDGKWEGKYVPKGNSLAMAITGSIIGVDTTIHQRGRWSIRGSNLVVTVTARITTAVVR